MLTSDALMRPISARSGVAARFVMPGQARFILHNEDGARKRFFDIGLRAVRCEPQDSLR